MAKCTDPACTCQARAALPSTEVRVTNASGGQKGMKPVRMGLIPWDALGVIARVYHYGATKYHDPVVGPHNWRRGYAWSLNFDALMRHLGAWWEGQDVDPESGHPHLAHAAWHVITLIWFSLHRRDLDDRPHTWMAKWEAQQQKAETPDLTAQESMARRWVPIGPRSPQTPQAVDADGTVVQRSGGTSTTVQNTGGEDLGYGLGTDPGDLASCTGTLPVGQSITYTEVEGYFYCEKEGELTASIS